MKLLPRLLLPALLLCSPLALAEPSSEDTIEVQFKGTLRDAIETIAEEGGLNVVVTGDLDVPAQVRLRGISAEQALSTVARAYSLKLEQDGPIYTLRPMSAEEKAAAQASGPSRFPPLPAMPPPPPLPTAGPVPPDVGAMMEGSLGEDALREQVRQKMRKVRRSSKGARDVVARGHSLEVKSGEAVDSAVVYGGNLTVNGTVEDDAVVFGGNLMINGHVEGDAAAFGGNVLLGPDAVVEGDVSSFGGSVQRQDGAKVEGGVSSMGGANVGRMVAGELKKNLREAKAVDTDADNDADEKRGGGFAFFVLEFALLFGLGFLGQMIFPARMKELGEEIRRHPGRSGVVGLLGTLALIPALLVLTVTIIGIPVALALVLVLPLLTVLGFAAVASELGKKLPALRGQKTQASALALGLLVLLAVGQIPVLGALVLTLAAFISLGAITRTRFGQRPQGLPEPIPSERVAM